MRSGSGGGRGGGRGRVDGRWLIRHGCHWDCTQLHEEKASLTNKRAESGWDESESINDAVGERDEERAVDGQKQKTYQRAGPR